MHLVSAVHVVQLVDQQQQLNDHTLQHRLLLKLQCMSMYAPVVSHYALVQLVIEQWGSPE